MELHGYLNKDPYEWKEGGREGGKEGGREGEREGGRKGGREGGRREEGGSLAEAIVQHGVGYIAAFT